MNKYAISMGVAERARATRAGRARAASAAAAAGGSAAAAGDAAYKQVRGDDIFKRWSQGRKLRAVKGVARKVAPYAVGVTAAAYLGQRALNAHRALVRERELEKKAYDFQDASNRDPKRRAYASDWEFNDLNRMDVRRHVHANRAESKARVAVAGARGRNRGALAGALLGGVQAVRKSAPKNKVRHGVAGALGGALLGAAVGRTVNRARKSWQIGREADKESRRYRNAPVGA